MQNELDTAELTKPRRRGRPRERLRCSICGCELSITRRRRKSFGNFCADHHAERATATWAFKLFGITDLSEALERMTEHRQTGGGKSKSYQAQYRRRLKHGAGNTLPTSVP